MEEEYKKHQNDKRMSRLEKETDKAKAKCDKSIYAATFDLEAVLTTPCGTVSQLYYSRKLCSYNLSVYNLADKRGTCYVWDETEGARGSSEIGTCIITHLKSLPPTVKHVVLYSDSCSGQNRNKYIASALLQIVRDSPIINVIEQKFLETGHTQMECDSMHSAIEHAKKATKIFVPSQWDTVIHMARYSKPYIVVPMKYYAFYDLRKVDFVQSFNFQLDMKGQKISWLKIKMLKVEKAKPDEIQIKYSYEDEEGHTLSLKRKGKRGRPCTSKCFVRKYTEKLVVSTDKKRDLVALCKTGIIPEEYHDFYKSLKTSEEVKDRVPVPDITEADPVVEDD